jgi:hypothetical protein
MSDAALAELRSQFAREQVMRRDPRVPLVAILCALCFVALLLFARLAFTTYDTLVGGIDAETDPTAIVVSVGTIRLSVPRNMIRNHPFARGSVSELELRLHWPTMEGFSEQRADAFRNNDERSTIIYASLRPSGAAMSPEDRARLVYSRLLDGPTTAGPSGLTSTPFGVGHGYDGETLYSSADEELPFVARCASDDGDVPATCIVEFSAEGGIDVLYRFRRHLLSRWRAIDAAMRGTTQSFLTKAGG